MSVPEASVPSERRVLNVPGNGNALVAKMGVLEVRNSSILFYPIESRVVEQHTRIDLKKNNCFRQVRFQTSAIRINAHSSALILVEN